MKEYLRLLPLFALFSFPVSSFAQNIGINGTGNNPDPSAMLDVEAADKGMLIPRVQLDDRTTAAPVAGPAEGLTIYNETGTEPKGFYYWDAGIGEWVMVGSNADDLYWDRDAGNGYLFPSTLGDQVGIGNNAPAGRLHVSFDNGATEHVVIDKANGSGFGPLTEWYGYSTTHSLTLAYDGAYNFFASSSSRDIEFDISVGNDWRVESSGEPDMLYVNGGDDVLGVGTQPGPPAIIDPPGVEVVKPMEIGEDNGNGTQATIGYWWSSNVAMMPEDDGFGYVGYYTGSNPFAWNEMNAYGFFNPSSEELKQDITPIEREAKLEEYVMKDIEKLEPAFYKYEETPESFEEGKDQYRPQMRLGLLAESSPDYLLGNSFDKVDIYASSALALAGVKYNKKRIDRLEKEKMEVRDIGTATITGEKELRVKFSDPFRQKLDGETPVLHLTSYDPEVSVGIKEKDDEGFVLYLPDKVRELKVDWVAVAKVPASQDDNGEGRIDPELLKRLDVPKEEKDQLIEYLKKLEPSKEKED